MHLDKSLGKRESETGALRLASVFRRDLPEFLRHRAFGVELMRSVHVPVIGGQDHDRVVGETGGIELSQQGAMSRSTSRKQLRYKWFHHPLSLLRNRRNCWTQNNNERSDN